MAPSISVIIPVGPNHAHYLPAALRSVEAQTVKDWECLIVDDSGEPSDQVFEAGRGDYRVFVSQTRGRQGASFARNLGMIEAQAPWVVFLDADDELLPRALEHLLTGAAEHPDASYIYGDWWNVRADRDDEYYQAPEYDQLRFLHNNVHVVTALYPAKVIRDLGGFDEDLRGYEDWELNLRLAMAGYCGRRVPFPIISYRIHAGFRREWSRQNEPELVQAIQRDKYGDYLTGKRRPMACCGQVHGQPTPQMVVQQFGIQEATMSDQPMVRMEYTGTNEGFIPYQNPFGGSGRTYRGGVGINKYADVDPVDVPFLEQTGVWKVIKAGDKSERPRRDMEAVIVHTPEAQAAADALVESGDVEMPKRKASKKDGE